MSMYPAPWPEPDPQVAAAIGAMHGAGKAARPLAVLVRDRLGQWLGDDAFAAAFGTRGKPGWSPSRLALVTVPRRAEKLTGRQASDAVRIRLDWKYLLGLPAGPRRGRCRSCGATQQLVPAWAVPRREDAAGTIARAAAASALRGAGSRSLGREFGVPAGTVRGWLRRLRKRAGWLRQEATVELAPFTTGRDFPCMAPCGSALGDAVAAVIACARAAIMFCGYGEDDQDALLGRLGIAAALAPAPGS